MLTKPTSRWLAAVVLAAAAVGAGWQLAVRAAAGDDDRAQDGFVFPGIVSFSGTWYGELDAEPFGLPAGVSLAALMSIHADGTMIVSDAGDFGAAPISLIQSPQFGSWARTGPRSIRATSLFFGGSPTTLDATVVKRAKFRLHADSRDHLSGVAEIVEQLDCPAGPLPGFLSCPNPITAPDAAWVPEPGGAPNVPFEAWRLRAN